MDRIIELIIYCQGNEFTKIREFPSNCSIVIKTKNGELFCIAEGYELGDPIRYKITYVDVQPDKGV